MTDFCFDCKYSSTVNNMQACAWDSGLVNTRRKCDRYERSWSKFILPYMALFTIIFLFVRIFIAAIWGI